MRIDRIYRGELVERSPHFGLHSPVLGRLRLPGGSDPARLLTVTAVPSQALARPVAVQ